MTELPFFKVCALGLQDDKEDLMRQLEISLFLSAALDSNTVALKPDPSSIVYHIQICMQS